jgi:hypothetical protein
MSRLIKNTPTFLKTRNGDTILFRSRLEARWGFIFDALDLEWVYEPAQIRLGNNFLYLPDFFIKEVGFIEIKPSVETLANEGIDKLLRAGEIISEFSSSNSLISIFSSEPSFGWPSPNLSHITWSKKQINQITRNAFINLLVPGIKSDQKKLSVTNDNLLEALIYQSSYHVEHIPSLKDSIQHIIMQNSKNSAAEMNNWMISKVIERSTMNKIINSFVEELDSKYQEIFQITA